MPATSPWALTGFYLALLSAIAMLLSPVGYRLGWWGVKVALIYLVGAAVVIAAIALVVSLVAALRSRPGSGKKGFGLAVAGIAISVVFGLFPLSQAMKAKRVPAIHDITTDTDNPPAFVALAAARRAAPNGLDYQGAEIAGLQRKAYPGILTFHSKLPAEQLFAKAQQIVVESGWQIAAAAPADGRIEATDSSALYGFKDDVVIRVAADGTGSKLDMRSMSRVGQSDVGANAARIRKFLDRLKASGG